MIHSLPSADSNSPASEGKAVCWDWKNTWSQKPSSNSEFTKLSFLTFKNPQVHELPNNHPDRQYCTGRIGCHCTRIWYRTSAECDQRSPGKTNPRSIA